MNKILRVIALLLIGNVVAACDPYHKEKCEWYLVPEPSHIDLVEPGWVSLCARNYVVNKQRCYLRATIEYSKAVFGKPFRLATMKVRQVGPYPREVDSIKVCQPEGEEAERIKRDGNKPKEPPTEPASELDED